MVDDDSGNGSVWAAFGWMAVPDPGGPTASVVFSLEDVLCTAPEPSAAVVSVSTGVAAVVAGSIVVWVNRLNKLVLSPPTPTAGTAPSSVPLPVAIVDEAVFWLVCGAACSSAVPVGACRLLGEPWVTVGRLLTT